MALCAWCAMSFILVAFCVGMLAATSSRLSSTRTLSWPVASFFRCANCLLPCMLPLIWAKLRYLASRLGFDCTPKGKFLGLHVNGKRVSFTENVFYEFRREKIEQVWSVIDKAAIEAQL